MDYAELQEYHKRVRAKARERYAFARSLGFASKECVALASCSEETIRRIAAERDAMKLPV